MKQLFTTATLLAGLVTASFAAVSAPKSLLDVQHEWANINYNMEDDAKVDAFDALIDQTEMLAKNGDVELVIWLGINQSTMAGTKKGIGALKYAKAAKKSFEKAIGMDESALDGSALTSLGVLYHKVPGWPVGFGNDEKANELMLKALAINPTGIDPNYFYAEYLYDEGEFAKAKEYALIAQKAPARADRPLADTGRQQELAALLQKIEAEL